MEIQIPVYQMSVFVDQLIDAQEEQTLAKWKCVNVERRRSAAKQSIVVLGNAAVCVINVPLNLCLDITLK